MHRRTKAKRSPRRGLAPLELVLSLPFLMIMLAVIILGMMSLAIYRFVQANVTAMRPNDEFYMMGRLPKQA
mgnify:CR=1 FL=1